MTAHLARFSRSVSSAWTLVLAGGLACLAMAGIRSCDVTDVDEHATELGIGAQ